LGAIDPVIEVLHCDEHSVELYDCAFAVSERSGEEGHRSKLSPPTVLHRERKLFSRKPFNILLKEKNADSAKVVCGWLAQNALEGLELPHPVILDRPFSN
jgi:hypothetical protein